MPSMVEHFATLEDPRVERAKRHSLLAIVTIALCGVICGAESWVEIAEFGRAKADWFATFLDLGEGLPSHDTFGRVFARLDPEQFAACSRDWMAAVAAVVPAVADPAQQQDPVIALDGKALRRSHDRTAGKAALHLVSAWATASRLVLAQVAVDDKSNEITAFPLLLRQLDLAGCIVTIDAMGCQREIAAQIVAQDGDYVLALKDNQPTLAAEVADSFMLARASGFAEYARRDWDYARQVHKGHGRLEVREHWVLADASVLAYLAESVLWPGLEAIGLVDAERRLASGVVEREARYYLLSRPLSAQRFADAVRRHWGIENQLHWLLDVAFGEDESRVRIGHAAETFAILRRLALHLLRQDTTARCGIKARRLKAGWSHEYLLHILSG